MSCGSIIRKPGPFPVSSFRSFWAYANVGLLYASEAEEGQSVCHHLRPSAPDVALSVAVIRHFVSLLVVAREGIKKLFIRVVCQMATARFDLATPFSGTHPFMRAVWVNLGDVRIVLVSTFLSRTRYWLWE